MDIDRPVKDGGWEREEGRGKRRRETSMDGMGRMGEGRGRGSEVRGEREEGEGKHRWTDGKDRGAARGGSVE